MGHSSFGSLWSEVGFCEAEFHSVKEGQSLSYSHHILSAASDVASRVCRRRDLGPCLRSDPACMRKPGPACLSLDLFTRIHRFKITVGWLQAGLGIFGLWHVNL